MSDPPRFRQAPVPHQRRPRTDDIVAIVALVVVAIVMVLALVLSHPAKDSGVGGRVPTISQTTR